MGRTVPRGSTDSRLPILVAKAIPARGLDIKGVEHLVNYDMPSKVDE